MAIGCGCVMFVPLADARSAAVEEFEFEGRQEPAAQDAVGEIEEAVRTLKARKLPWEKKMDAMDLLLASGPDACAELAKHLSKFYPKLHASFLKDQDRLMEDFEKAAAKLARSRLDKPSLKRIDELRRTWLKTSRSSGLTKAQVHEVCDKAHEEIQVIVDVTVSQVWESAPKLDGRWDELVLELDDVLLVYDYLTAAREELLKGGKAWAGKSYVKKVPPDPNPYEEGMYFALDRAARLATVMPERDRKTILANEPNLVNLTAEETAGIIELNRIRVRAGLSALRLDLKLCEAGRGHSQDMVEHDFFAHVSPVPGKKTPGNRAALAGTSGGAENIAFGQETGLEVIQAWWYSPGHHRNMMDNHGRVGLGRFNDHWTQMFD